MTLVRPRIVPIKATDDWSSVEIESNRMRLGGQNAQLEGRDADRRRAGDRIPQMPLTSIWLVGVGSPVANRLRLRFCATDISSRCSPSAV
jgi:hypothetical protein